MKYEEAVHRWLRLSRSFGRTKSPKASRNSPSHTCRIASKCNLARQINRWWVSLGYVRVEPVEPKHHYVLSEPIKVEPQVAGSEPKTIKHRSVLSEPRIHKHQNFLSEPITSKLLNNISEPKATAFRNATSKPKNDKSPQRHKRVNAGREPQVSASRELISEPICPKHRKGESELTLEELRKSSSEPTVDKHRCMASEPIPQEPQITCSDFYSLLSSKTVEEIEKDITQARDKAYDGDPLTPYEEWLFGKFMNSTCSISTLARRLKERATRRRASSSKARKS